MWLKTQLTSLSRHLRNTNTSSWRSASSSCIPLRLQPLQQRDCHHLPTIASSLMITAAAHIELVRKVSPCRLASRLCLSVEANTYHAPHTDPSQNPLSYDSSAICCKSWSLHSGNDRQQWTHFLSWTQHKKNLRKGDLFCKPQSWGIMTPPPSIV